MLRKLIPLICIIFFLTLAACGSNLSNENLGKVETGMTEKQVKSILGKPDSVETQGALGVEGTVFTYKAGKKEVKIYFGNGKVLMKKGSF